MFSEWRCAMLIEDVLSLQSAEEIWRGHGSSRRRRPEQGACTVHYMCKRKLFYNGLLGLGRWENEDRMAL